MSVLQGPCGGKKPSYLPPGIWISTEDIDKPIKSVEAPLPTTAPRADATNLSLSGSGNATKDKSEPRSHHGLPNLRAPLPVVARSRTISMTEPKPSGSRIVVRFPGVEERQVVGIQTPAPPAQESAIAFDDVRRHVRALLVAIEMDLLHQFYPLVVQYWEALPLSERITVSEIPENLPNLELIIWKVFQFTFDVAFPNSGTLRAKIRNGDFAFNWNSWMCWANPELAMSSELEARKPTAKELFQFIQDWEVLWEDLLQYTPEDRLECFVRARTAALGSWKTITDLITPMLDG
jgi:hypothetical protein